MLKKKKIKLFPISFNFAIHSSLGNGVPERLFPPFTWGVEVGGRVCAPKIPP